MRPCSCRLPDGTPCRRMVCDDLPCPDCAWRLQEKIEELWVVEMISRHERN